MWTQHDIFVATLRRYHGVPYVWSGGHQGKPYPEAGGVDCSGLIRLALIDARVRLPAWDSNSQGMYVEFEKCTEPGVGVLAFFAKPGSMISHVEPIVGMVDGQWVCLGARGSMKSVCYTRLHDPRPFVELYGFANPFKEF